MSRKDLLDCLQAAYKPRRSSAVGEPTVESTVQKKRMNKAGKQCSHPREMISVRAYARQKDSDYIAEAEVKLNSNGGLDIEMLSVKLQLQGSCHVSG